VPPTPDCPCPSESSLVAAYEVAAEDLRANVALRSRHFATYLGLTTLISAGVFLTDVGAWLKTCMSATGLVASLLFWQLDARTHQEFRTQRQRLEQLEKALALPPRPIRVGFKASRVTWAIFGLVVAWWLAIACYWLASAV